MSHISEVPSPCIKLCSLDKQNICVGCYRSLEEIACWRQAGDLQRQKILELSLLRRQLYLDTV